MRIESVETGEEAAPAGAHLRKSSGERIVKRVDVPAVTGNFRNGVDAVSQQRPEFLEPGRAREPASYAHDGDWVGASRLPKIRELTFFVAVALRVAGEAMGIGLRAQVVPHK